MDQAEKLGLTEEELSVIIEKYPPIAEMVELHGHHELHNDVARICRFLVRLVDDYAPTSTPKSAGAKKRGD